MTDFADLLKIAGEHKKKAADLDVSAQNDVRSMYQKALKSYLKYLGTRVRKNPATTIDQLVKRDDVVSNFRSSWEQTRLRVRERVTSAYKQGFEVGVEQAKAEAAAMGVDLPSPDEKSRTYFDQLLKDVDRQMKDLEVQALDQFQRAFWDKDVIARDKKRTRDERKAHADEVAVDLAEDIARLSSAMSTRASLSVSVALQRGLNDGHMFTYAGREDITVKKVWLANFALNTPPCATCSALHGTVIAVDKEFPAGLSYATNPPAVYQDLQSPPRHPRCRCLLIFMIEGRDDDGRPISLKVDRASPKGLRTYSRSRAKETTRDESRPGVSSQDIRDMSGKEYKSWSVRILSKLKSWWRKWRG